MEVRARDIFFGAIFSALVVAGLAAGTYVWGFTTGRNTAEAEVIVETVEVPQIVEKPVLVEVEKPCIVTCMEQPCVAPCEEVPEVPTAAPKPTIPTPAVPDCPTEFGDHELQKYETWQVPACWTCLGDIEVEGTPLYDVGIAETGLVVYFTESAEIYAEWGANCISGDQREEKKAEALESGCGFPTGCEKVYVYVWPEDPN